MACDSSCEICSSPGVSLVNIQALSAPQQAEYNQLVTVSFNIQAGVAALGTIAICLYDLDSTICLQSKTINVYPLGNYPISFNFPMQNRTMNLNISVMDAGIVTNCEDVKTFSISLYQPPGYNYGCNPSTGLCQQGFGNMSSGCGGICTGTGGTSCSSSTDMKLLGMCVPKQVIFLGFALTALYMVTKG